jgi:HrpA-like RNA helicase
MAILNRLRTDRPNLKLILMSATVHSELIQSYFSPCPVVQIPGRMFHVSEFYLEDINALVRTGQLIQSGMVASHPNDIPEDDGPSTSRPENQKNFHRVAEDQIAEFVIRLIQRENALKQRTLQEDGELSHSSSRL